MNVRWRSHPLSPARLLAMMLGVQRTGVSCGRPATGLIRYWRGNITVIDRRGLIKRSCEWYGVSKKELSCQLRW